MQWRRFVVLANSYKNHGRCVAGRELGAGGFVGNWIRPISDQPEGELLDNHMRLADGVELEILDVVCAPITGYANDRVHPEDWRLDLTTPWRRTARFSARDVPTLEEKPPDLWVDPGTRLDRATTRFLVSQPRHQSLYLVRPRHFHIRLTNDFNPFMGRNKRERRACFTYGEREYALSLTDPEFLSRHGGGPAPNDPAVTVRPSCEDDCVLCVSLTPVFNGYHYKIVATVLELP